MRVWLTEKFDQAEKLAALLGNPIKRRGYFDTNDGRVTHAIGHLLQDAGPEAYNPAWKVWSFDALPMLPEHSIKLPDADKKQQLAVVVDCLQSASEIVIATDAGQEGEAIAREVIEHAQYRGPIRRLWTHSLDPASMKKALVNLRDGDSTLPLYHASQARAKADWYIGMNLTRAYTLRARAIGAEGVRSVGRVQTPTLALVVRRDREIEAFVVRTYYDVSAVATTATGESVTLTHAPKGDARLFDRAAAEALAKAAASFAGPLQVEHTERSTPPPRLFNLTTLQKAMSHRQGWSVGKTLEVAQALYDKGVVTYPRTSGSYLPNEQEAQIPGVLDALASMPTFARHIAAVQVRGAVVRPTVFNTKKADEDEHHAIIPTLLSGAKANLSTDEAAMYVLIAQSYIAALLPDYRYNETIMRLDVAGTLYSVTGRVPVSSGWKAALEESAESDADDDAVAALPNIPHGTRVTLSSPEIHAKKTRPPKRYTEADLVGDMESVAKFATDPVIRARLKENAGIGTPATRTGIIEGIKHRKYLESEGKFIVSTAIGREHIDGLPPPLTDAAMTALWEERLEAIRKGELDAGERAAFVSKIGANVTRLVDALRTQTAQLAAGRAPSPAQTDLAQKVAAALGVPLPPDVLTHFNACTVFLNTQLPVYHARPPSPAQIALVEKIAAERSIELPADVRTSQAACRAFLDAHAIVEAAKRSRTKPSKAKTKIAPAGRSR